MCLKHVDTHVSVKYFQLGIRMVVWNLMQTLQNSTSKPWNVGLSKMESGILHILGFFVNDPVLSCQSQDLTILSFFKELRETNNCQIITNFTH